MFLNYHIHILGLDVGVGDIVGKYAHNRALGAEAKASRSHYIHHIIYSMSMQHHLEKIDDALTIVFTAALTRATLHLHIFVGFQAIVLHVISC